MDVYVLDALKRPSAQAAALKCLAKTISMSSRWIYYNLHILNSSIVVGRDAANIRWVFVIRHIRQFFQFSRIFVIRYFWKI